MMNAYKLAAITGAAAMLGGCQSFPLTSWMFEGSNSAAEQPTRLAVDSAVALEEGRLALRSGNLAAAIASFQIATLDPFNRAEAANGLAVAYAKLGRLDLAERYFQAAISADPEDTKYVANLLRLQQQVLLARRQDSAQLAAVSQANRAAQRVHEQIASTIGGPVVRVSQAEVHVRSVAQPSAAPTIEVAFRDLQNGQDGIRTADSEEGFSKEASTRSKPLTVAFSE